MKDDWQGLPARAIRDWLSDEIAQRGGNRPAYSPVAAGFPASCCFCHCSTCLTLNGLT